MKKFFTTLVMVVVSATTLMSTATATSATSANTGIPPLWKVNSLEENYMYYDFNDDSMVNVLDKIAAKQLYLDKKLSESDLNNVNSYLFKGEIENINYEEIDMDCQNICIENDELFTEIISGTVVDSWLDDSTLRIRFLKDGTVTELRSSTYGSEVPFISSDKVSIVKTNYGTTYGFGVELLKQHPIIKHAFDSFVIPYLEILTVLETESGINIYSVSWDHRFIFEFNLKNTCTIEDIKNITNMFYYNSKWYTSILTKDDKFSLFNGYSECYNLDVMNLYNSNIEELIKNLSGEAIQINDDLSIFIKDGDNLKKIIVSSKGETITTIKTFEIATSKTKLILGINKDGRFCWDINSSEFEYG